MHSAIIVVEQPNDDRIWDSFLARSATDKAPPNSVQRLSENAWQVNARADLHCFARILVAAETTKLSYKMLVFDAEPQWIEANASHASS